MAQDPQKPGAVADPPQAGVVERQEPPKFSEVAREQQAARTDELRDLAGVSRREAPARPTDAPEGARTEAYDGLGDWEKLPENLRSWATAQYEKLFNDALASQYGDLIPLITEAAKNDNLRQALAAAGNDPELRDLLADADFRRDFKKLSKKEVREFLFGPAYDTYQKYEVAPGPGPDREQQPDRVAQLEQRFDAERDERGTVDFITSRQSEVRALKAEYPDLSDDQLGHVVRLTEERFEAAANRAGIKTREGDRMVDNWVGTALRAGIKPPQYREYAGQYREVLGRSAPPAAARGTQRDDEPPAPPQAPRNATEARAAGIRALQEVKRKNPAFQPRARR